MDPTACLMEVISHLADNEPGEAQFSLDALRTWHSRGGFRPIIPGTDESMSAETWDGVCWLLQHQIKQASD